MTDLELQLIKALEGLMIAISPNYSINNLETYFKEPMRQGLLALKKVHEIKKAGINP